MLQFIYDILSWPILRRFFKCVCVCIYIYTHTHTCRQDTHILFLPFCLNLHCVYYLFLPNKGEGESICIVEICAHVSAVVDAWIKNNCHMQHSQGIGLSTGTNGAFEEWSEQQH